MPVLPTYPGVYIEELSSGVRTITGVATSVTAFIGRARKGPPDEPVEIFSFGDYERSFGGLWNSSPMSFAVRDFFLNGGGVAIIVRVHKNAESANIRLPTGQASPYDEITLVAVSPGTWGDDLSIKIDHETIKLADGITPDPTLFNITIAEKGGLNEKFFNVTMDSTKPSYLKRVLEQESSLMRMVPVAPNLPAGIVLRPGVTGKDQNGIGKDVVLTPAGPIGISPFSPPEFVMSPLGSPPGSATTQSSDGVHITNLELTGTGFRDTKRGLYALEKTDIFNLLCIPPYATDTGTSPADSEKPTDVETSLISEAIAYCEERRAMFIVDPHSLWNSMATAKKKFSDFVYPASNSKNAALFNPRLKQANPLMNNQVEAFVPCGAIAGVFARTDAERGVWKAPAGQDATLRGVTALSVPLTDMENGELNKLGINCLRAFPVYGMLVWGARTLNGADQLASEWKYTPVRRTALFIEESLYRGTKWIVFEPNDESLWAQIRLNIGAFMHNLFRQGAFQGKTPSEAYLVKCDKETTTQNDINSGIVNILVGFAPLKPAEFVMIKIQQLAGQVET